MAQTADQGTHQTLYRKWRPQRFAEVVGQPHVVRTLTNALASGKSAHAYLFAGPRGTGKTTVARLLAKGLNCEQGPTPEPCNQCASCRQIAGGSSLDVMEIDGASNRGIDEIRELRDRIRFAPARSRFKVYIIDEVHMLTNEAFNALLKMLEEPPAHVVFIFATTDPQKVLPTILSRCQRFDFRRLSTQELVAHLAAVTAAEGIPADEPALVLIARHADGGARDALSLLEQCASYRPEGLDVPTVAEVLGLVRPEALAQLAAATVEGRAADALSLLERLIDEEGIDGRLVARDLIDYVREAATLKMLRGTGKAGASLAPAAFPGVDALAESTSLARLVSAMETLANAAARMRWAPDPRIAVELAVMQLGLGEAQAAAADPPARAPARPATRPAPSTPSRPAMAQPAPSVPAASPPGPRPTAPAPQGSPPAPVQAAAQPEAPRAAVDEPPRQKGELTLDEVQRRWPDVLSALRNNPSRRSAARVEALLREGHPIRAEAYEVTVGFPADRAFHRNAIEEDPRARDLVEKTMSRMFGQPVTFHTELLDGTSDEDPWEAPPAAPAPESVPSAPPPSPAPPAMPPAPAAVKPGPVDTAQAGAAPERRPPAPRRRDGNPGAKPEPNGAAARPRNRNGARAEPGAGRTAHEDPFDEATLRAVLDLMGGRIIREFDESGPAAAQDTPGEDSVEGDEGPAADS